MKQILLVIITLCFLTAAHGQRTVSSNNLISDAEVNGILDDYSSLYEIKSLSKDYSEQQTAIAQLFLGSVKIKNDCSPGSGKALPVKDYFDFIIKHFDLGVLVEFQKVQVVNEKQKGASKEVTIRYTKTLLGYYLQEEVIDRSFTEIMKVTKTGKGNWRIVSLEPLEIPLIDIGLTAGALFSNYNMGNSSASYPVEGFSSSTEFSLTYGLRLGLRIKSGFGFSTGFNIREYNTSISVSAIDQEPLNSIDIDGDSYWLYAEAEGIADNVSLSYYNIPVKLEYTFINKGKVYPFVGLGVNINILQQATSSISGVSTHEGYYPQYHALLYDIPELGFLTDHSFELDEDLKIKQTSMSGEINAGILIPVIVNKMFVCISGWYELAFSDVLENNSYYFSDAPQEYNSLLLSRQNAKAGSYGINMGLRIKL